MTSNKLKNNNFVMFKFYALLIYIFQKSNVTHDSKMIFNIFLKILLRKQTETKTKMDKEWKRIF